MRIVINVPINSMAEYWQMWHWFREVSEAYNVVVEYREGIVGTYELTHKEPGMPVKES